MTTDLKLIEKIVGILRRAADQELANGLKDTWPGFCPNADIKIKEGKFTHDNLIAHQAVAMTLGEHKGLMVAAAIVQQILEEENVHDESEEKSKVI